MTIQCTYMDCKHGQIGRKARGVLNGLSVCSTLPPQLKVIIIQVLKLIFGLNPFTGVSLTHSTGIQLVFTGRQNF